MTRRLAGSTHIIKNLRVRCLFSQVPRADGWLAEQPGEPREVERGLGDEQARSEIALAALAFSANRCNVIERARCFDATSCERRTEINWARRMRCVSFHSRHALKESCCEAHPARSADLAAAGRRVSRPFCCGRRPPHSPGILASFPPATVSRLTTTTTA